MLLKSVDTEERTITAVVLEPNDPAAGATEDLHNDYYTAEEVAKACESFNQHCWQPNVEHAVQVDKETAEILHSFIVPVPARIGEQNVKAGTWIQVWKLHDDALWSAVKEGGLTGFSIACSASYEDLE